jgi:hypothetical protein
VLFSIKGIIHTSEEKISGHERESMQQEKELDLCFLA